MDAAAEPDRIMDLIGPDGVSLIVTTHRHPDHWQALAEVVARTGAPTAAHALDAPGIPVPTDRLLLDGDSIEVGACSLEAIHLVGHTPGSIALLYDDPAGQPHLITGDCLFPGGVGKTHDPADFDSLLTGVVTKVFDRLPRRDLGVPRPRLGHHARRRAPGPAPSGATAAGSPPPFLPETGTNRR